MCRTKFAYVKYTFTLDGIYKMHIPGKGDQGSDPFLRDDEIVPPSASEGERRRKIDLRRLRTLEDIGPFSFIFDRLISVTTEGDTIVTVNRDMHLFYHREQGVKSQFIFQRRLTFKTLRDVSLPIPKDLNFEPERMAQARGYVIKCLDGLGTRRLFAEIHVDGPEYMVNCDERGLEVVAMCGLIVQRKLGVEDITIQESLAISEQFLPELPPEEGMAEDVVKDIGREEREVYQDGEAGDAGCFGAFWGYSSVC
jgi:hypothetical protein